MGTSLSSFCPKPLNFSGANQQFTGNHGVCKVWSCGSRQAPHMLEWNSTASLESKYLRSRD